MTYSQEQEDMIFTLKLHVTSLVFIYARSLDERIIIAYLPSLGFYIYKRIVVMKRKFLSIFVNEK